MTTVRYLFQLPEGLKPDSSFFIVLSRFFNATTRIQSFVSVIVNTARAVSVMTGIAGLSLCIRTASCVAISVISKFKYSKFIIGWLCLSLKFCPKQLDVFQ